MRKMKFLASALVAGALSLLSTEADAAFVLNFGEDSESSNNPATGASGTAEFTFLDVGNNIDLTLKLTNTTGTVEPFGNEATDGFLVGFGFNLVSGVSYIPNSFVVISGGIDEIEAPGSANPFGVLDLIASTGGAFEGGGSPKSGLAENGGMGVVKVSLSSSLSASDVESAFSAAFANAAPDTLAAAMRFRGISVDPGSDRVLFMNPNSPGVTTPLPAAAWMLIAGLGGLAGMRRLKASKTA